MQSKSVKRRVKIQKEVKKKKILEKKCPINCRIKEFDSYLFKMVCTECGRQYPL